MLHQNEGGIEKSIPETREFFGGRSPRKILKVKGNLEGRGDRFPNSSLILMYGHSLIINLSTGSGVNSVDQEILPREQERIVKINPSLLMMRELHN